MRRRTATQRQLIDFTILLSTMLEAGLPITTSLDAAIEEVAERGGASAARWLQVLTGIHDHVEAGGRLSDAFSFYPDFTDTYVNMVRAGEISGKLGAMLDRVASFLESDADTRGAVRGAMIYPGAMAVIAALCVTFLLVYIFPKFKSVFMGQEKLLPWPTKMFFVLSDILLHDWPWVVGGLVGLVALVLYARTLAPVRRLLDGLKLRVPAVRYVVRFYILSRTLKTMGILIEAGVGILEVIRTVRDISHNVHYARMWEEVGESVSNGNPLSDVIAESPLMPASVVQVIAAGERTGQTGPMMIRIADRMEKELNRSIKAMTTLIEPIMIVVMGALVGTIAASLMLPLFNMSRAVR